MIQFKSRLGANVYWARAEGLLGTARCWGLQVLSQHT
jgi:hypothetical protein